MTKGAYLDRYGPVALVTGASSGIGWAFAEALAARGFDLVLTARRGQRLDELAAMLREREGVSVRCIEADLGCADGPGRLLAATAGEDIALVVSNAGFSMKGRHQLADAAALTEMLMVNCHAPLQLTRGFIPRLLARGKGAVILTSSVEGFLGGPYSAAYAASKALATSLGEGLWAELRPEGIDVLALCPGATESEAAERAGLDPARIANMMKARDVAELALDNIANGPSFVPSAHYRASFDALLAMPRRDALLAMAEGLRKAGMA